MMKKTLLIITAIHWTGLINTMDTDPLKAITQSHQQNSNLTHKPSMDNKDIEALIQQVINEQRQKKTNPDNTIISKL